MTLADRLAGVGEILIAISGSPLPTHVFQSLADHAPTVIACDYLAVCLPDAEGAAGYLVHPLVEPDPAGGAPRSCGAGQGVPGRAMASSRPIVVDDLATGVEGAGPLEAGWVAAGLRSLVAAPLRRTGDLPGALVFGARAVGAYDGDDVRIATLLAGGIAATLGASRAYQALADERSTLGAVVGSMQDAVLVVSVAGLVLMANPAVHAMLGLHPDTLAGQPLAEVMPEGPLRTLLASGTPGVSELPLPDGRTAHASVVPVTTPYGEAVGVAAILRDVTHFKELEQMKNTFVHTVSHDLKNPIASVVLTTEMMQRAGPANPRYGEHCEMILRVARSMGELVGDLLDLGRIESGMDAVREPVDVVGLVRDVAAALAPQAEAKRIALSVTAPPRATVLASPGRIRQVLANLAGNAVKYTPDGGRVDIVLTAEGAEVRVTVTDSGIGIPASALPYVFDKFYRVKSAATREIEGTGLGLAITKSIVEAH
ncbi:MAG TPA: ATP-binding protein, partial [Methylomirabilota bacterium]|nr:ATP-binding protein [Methylomirabilota bacterium]